MAGSRLHAPGPRDAVHGEFIMRGDDDDRTVCVPQASPRHRPHGVGRLSGGLAAVLACPLTCELPGKELALDHERPTARLPLQRECRRLTVYGASGLGRLSGHQGAAEWARAGVLPASPQRA